MAPRVAVALLALAALAAPALATYGAGSELEADAPVLLTGRTDALASGGIATFVSNDPRTALSLAFSAGELHVQHKDVKPCSATLGVPCLPTERGFTSEDVTLTAASVTLQRVASAYKVLVTNDASAGDASSTFGVPGPLVASAGAGTLLGAASRPMTFSPYEDDWATGDPKAPTADVYAVEAQDTQLSGLGGTLQAAHGFEVMLQGLTVRVTGLAPDGSPFDKTFDTAVGGEGARFLVLEATDGLLSATSNAPLQAFRVGTVDTAGTATLNHAEGTLKEDDGETTHDGSGAATLRGPVSLTVTSVKAPARDGEPARMTFAVSSSLRVLDALDAPPRDERDPLQLVAAGAAGAGVAGLVAALAYFWPRVKLFLTLLALPLYTRIERTAVLEHEKRDEIYELIRAQPGIHAHEIGERAQIGWGTTVYHLKLLEQHSLVVSKKSGRYKRFFVNTGEYTKKKDAYGALRNDTAKAVADFIVNHPGCSQKELCAALGIQPSLASWHVDKLEGVELVKRVKDGRQVRYFAGPAWESLNVRIDPRGGADTPAET